MQKHCSVCSTSISKHSRTLLCEKCRVKKWHLEHKERVTQIKNDYVLRNPDRRRKSWQDYNVNHKDLKRFSNQLWYDKYYFNNQRLKLISEHNCNRCDSDKNLHVHHRDGIGVTSPVPNNTPSNLVVLCASCHRKVHERKEYPFYVGA